MVPLKGKLILTCFFFSLVGCVSNSADSKNTKVLKNRALENQYIDSIKKGFNHFNVTQKSYIKSKEDIANPGRGFYQHIETGTSPYTPLNKNSLVNSRQNYQASNANYTSKSTLILRAFILDSYITNGILSDNLLANIQADFDIAREAGVKMVVRFYYHKNSTPPYGDPKKEIILAHIQQLMPILKNNADVILAIQQGFIGAWGEQYYTDNFSHKGKVTASYTDQNWSDRNEILAALLRASAPTTMVQVRTPQAKQKYIYGVSAPVIAGRGNTKNSLVADLAFNHDDIARIGFHNDCFLTDETDTGTYADYGTSGRPSKINPVNMLKNYHKHDSQYVIVGGETCKDENWASPPVPHKNNCSDGVVNTMNEFNYSYLNADYNNSVNNDWVEGKDACMPEIKNKLGYRLAITDSTFVTSAKAGNYIPLLLTLDNDGFTSVVTPMELRLILKHNQTGVETTFILDNTRNDVRMWQPGRIKLSEYIQLPNDLAAGNYSTFLHIADTANKGVISTRPEYSIQLANIGTWDESTGYNDLGLTISIQDFISSDINNQKPKNISIAKLASSERKATNAITDKSILIDGSNVDWTNIPVLTSAENQQLTSLKVHSDELYLYIALEGKEMGGTFDLFINTDDDLSTGFQSSDWVPSGADYLIQQGSGGAINLHSSLSTGWEWKQERSSIIKANNKNNFVEFKIKKSDFKTLNRTISVGVNDVNSTWAVQSRLPLAGEAMTSYKMQ